MIAQLNVINMKHKQHVHIIGIDRYHLCCYSNNVNEALSCKTLGTVDAHYTVFKRSLSQ